MVCNFYFDFSMAFIVFASQSEQEHHVINLVILNGQIYQRSISLNGLVYVELVLNQLFDYLTQGLIPYGHFQNSLLILIGPFRIYVASLQKFCHKVNAVQSYGSFEWKLAVFTGLLNIYTRIANEHIEYLEGLVFD